MDNNSNQPTNSASPIAQLPGVDHQHAQAAAAPVLSGVAPPDNQSVARHRESARRYPQLDLSQHEYVVSEVRRTPIGLVPIWTFVGIVTILILGVLPWYATNLAALQKSFTFELPSPVMLIVPLLLVCALLVVGGVIAAVVYTSNIIYVTNESVIQFIRASLFHTKQQTINLANIEDASYAKRGIIQQLFNYGTVRLSTQSQHNTYQFSYTPNPRVVANTINDAIERALQQFENKT